MLLLIVWLIFGLVLIIKGGDLFVAASMRIAELLDVPRVIIGSTLVSLATTSPELVISIISGLDGEPGLSVGNAVGSCICNIGLILGLLASIRRIDIHPRLLKTPLAVLIGFGTLLFVMTYNLLLSQAQGIFLIICGLAYYIYDFFSRKKKMGRSLDAEVDVTELETLKMQPLLKTLKGSTLQFAIGTVIVVGGSRLLVYSAVEIARELSIPPIIIGLTVIAVGTSLPELITMISSLKHHAPDLAVGNILGANVANLTFVVGSAASISPVSMSRMTQLVNFPVMILQPVFLYYVVFWDRKISRREGVILLGSYVIYLIVLVAITLMQKTG